MLKTSRPVFITIKFRTEIDGKIVKAKGRKLFKAVHYVIRSFQSVAHQFSLFFISNEIIGHYCQIVKNECYKNVLILDEFCFIRTHLPLANFANSSMDLEFYMRLRLYSDQWIYSRRLWMIALPVERQTIIWTTRLTIINHLRFETGLPSL